MANTTFNLLHPIVPAAYFIGVLLITMGIFQPPLLIAAVVIGVLYNAYLKGWAATVRSLTWQIPLVVIISLVNPIFSGSGSTELVRFDGQPIYLEALLYGACMGIMLMSVLVWMSCATQVITSDKLMLLTGKLFPIIGLMLSMCGRLVPQFVRRGRQIIDVQAACTAAGAAQQSNVTSNVNAQNALHKRASKLNIGEYLRASTALMGWSMEDSLESSDAMRARGWGATTRRTTYSRVQFKAADAVFLAVILILMALDIFCVFTFGGEFRFYPAIANLAPWWAYIPHIVFLLTPFMAEAWGYFLWKD